MSGGALPGAVEAVARLRARLPVRLVTNTTSRSHASLAAHLVAAGVLDRPEALVMPSAVARRVLPERGHDRGILLLEPEARADFGWFREDPAGPAVLLGTEGHDLTIADLQPAFRCLLEGGKLYALQQNRYFRKDGVLVTDLGPLAAFLGHAAGTAVECLGKPSATLFDAIAAEAGVRRADIIMAGDDAEVDASGSVALGLQGVLLRTGKYRAGDEDRVQPRPTAVLDGIAGLPGWLGF